MADEKPQLIWVASPKPSNEDGGDQIVFTDTDLNHPNRTAIVAGASATQVSENAAVKAALANNVIVKAAAPAEGARPRSAEQQRIAQLEAELAAVRATPTPVNEPDHARRGR